MLPNIEFCGIVGSLRNFKAWIAIGIEIFKSNIITYNTNPKQDNSIFRGLSDFLYTFSRIF
jgi:hypothetical protein